MDLPDWKQNLPKLPDLKRFQRSFQGPQGVGQGMWGSFAKFNSNMWIPKGYDNGSTKKAKNPGKKAGNAF
jgi:hypothetical protein